MQLEPLFGVWLSNDQVEAIFDFVSGAGTVTVTDLRDRSVELNLPPEIAGEISDFRGSVLVEQERTAGEGVQRMAIVDRKGETFPLDVASVRKLTDEEELNQLVSLASAVLREVHGRVDYDTWQDAHPVAASTLDSALDLWDQFEQLLTEES